MFRVSTILESIRREEQIITTHPDALPEVGDGWEVKLRWSGYAIASESRKDGGTLEYRVVAVDTQKRLVTVDTGRWVATLPWQELREKHLKEGVLISGRQTLQRLVKKLKKNNTPPQVIIGHDDRVRAQIRKHGLRGYRYSPNL